MERMKDIPPENIITLSATKGLWEFRYGDIERGRSLYEEARSMSSKREDKRLLALSSAFYAIEEASQEEPQHSVITSALRVFDKLDKIKDPILDVLEKRLNIVTKKIKTV